MPWVDEILNRLGFDSLVVVWGLVKLLVRDRNGIVGWKLCKRRQTVRWSVLGIMPWEWCLYLPRMLMHFAGDMKLAMGP